MATLPYFVLSPNTIASMIGFLRHRESDAQAEPFADWRTATVDVVIPARNEEKMIGLCLASLLKQTVKPRRVILIDDGSLDRTTEYAEAFARVHGLDLTVIHRRKAIGKTVTLKRQARDLDCDVMVIIDADTVLDSENYIERLVKELYQAVGVASVCGTVRPLPWRERRRLEDAPDVQRAWNESNLPAARAAMSRLEIVETGITNMYRDVLYMFLQRLIYRGEMLSFGSIINPVGCAVAYRRAYLARLFNEVEPEYGDDITNSEDIFIGFALLTRGYRNVQVGDIVAKTVEPPLRRLPRQIYLWSSAFLQSCYYFDDLLRSPQRWFAQWELRRKAAARARRVAQGAATAVASNLLPQTPPPPFATATVGVGDGSGGTPAINYQGVAELSGGGTLGPMDAAVERRRILEPYRQAFGTEHTRLYGRPTGWFLFTSACEKIAFPTILLVLLLLRNWFGLALSILAETTFSLTALFLVARGERLRYVLKGLLVAPLRYALLVADGVTIGWFAIELWISKNRKWRK